MCWAERGGERNELGAVCSDGGVEAAEEEYGAVYRGPWTMVSSELAHELIDI
jgi:hypothetical protein